MKEIVTLTRKEQTWALVLGKMGRGEITAGEAASLLSVGLRQVRRLLAAYPWEGATALVHGDRGRVRLHTVDHDLRQRVVELAGSAYDGRSHRHLSELLPQPENITLSRSTDHRLQLDARIRRPRIRRELTYRHRWERCSQHGMSSQIDDSDHDWLQGRWPRLALITEIDDATGPLEGALFRKQEDAGELLAPAASGHHRLWPPDRPLSRPPWRFSACQDRAQGVGVTSIPANSPQANGRIERLSGTLQDRLVIELRLAAASTIADANAAPTPAIG